MTALYEAGRWGFALNLIDHLPRASSFVQALTEDEDLAEQFASEGPGRRRTFMRDWSLSAEIQAESYNRLCDLLDVMVQANGGQSPRLERIHGPVSAAQVLESSRSRAAVDEMAAMLWPEGDGS